MAQARWRITGQTQRPGFGPNQRLIDFMDVTFELTETGEVGIVSVPLNQYTPERVAAEVQARADTMAAIRALGQ